jgi:hypothetical protein
MKNKGISHSLNQIRQRQDDVSDEQDNETDQVGSQDWKEEQQQANDSQHYSDPEGDLFGGIQTLSCHFSLLSLSSQW